MQKWFFFDAFHKKISDPGAYVYVQQQAGMFWYAMANSGWCTMWQKTTDAQLAELVFKNRQHQRRGSFYVKRVIKQAREGDYLFEQQV